MSTICFGQHFGLAFYTRGHISNPIYTVSTSFETNIPWWCMHRYWHLIPQHSDREQIQHWGNLQSNSRNETLITRYMEQVREHIVFEQVREHIVSLLLFSYISAYDNHLVTLINIKVDVTYNAQYPHFSGVKLHAILSIRCSYQYTAYPFNQFCKLNVHWICWHCRQSVYRALPILRKLLHYNNFNLLMWGEARPSQGLSGFKCQQCMLHGPY